MLQDIRANAQGTIAKIIIGLIVISFSIFGIESLLFSTGPTGVAEVNGEEITPFELQQELSVQQRQLLSMLGDDADPALLDDDNLKQRALDVLIQREILLQASRRLELTSSDQNVSDIIAQMEQFQVEGRFSQDIFQSSLASAGYTPSLFSSRLSEDLQIGQLRAGLAASDFTTEAELELAAAIIAEGRDVRYIELPLVDFELTAQITEDDIRAYYETNNQNFMSEEALVVEYVTLDLEGYREPVAEDRLREEFELARSEYDIPTETRVSHVLIEGNDADARARVAEVEEALSNGMDFAAAAEAFSDDVGSKRAGGDLGYTSGTAFPASMEESIASLAVGEVSGPVETEAGLHLILVTDRREGSEVQFDDVAVDLERQIQDGEAGAALLRDVETLRDLAFNAADLSAPADALGVEVKVINDVTRDSRDDILSIPEIRRALFSEDVLIEGHNSEVIELSPEEFVAMRVAERRAPSVLPLEVVRGQISAELRRSKARESADLAARELLASLESGVSVESAAVQAGLQWQVELNARRGSRRLPAAVSEELFSLPQPTDGPVRKIVSSDPESFYVLEFVRFTEGSQDALSPEERQALPVQLAGESGGITQQQIERALRAEADITIY